MTIQILDRRHYGQTLRRPNTPGWNPTTHLVKIHFPEVGERPAWVKIDPQIKPFVSNEIIGWIIARALGISAPEHAALLIEEAAWFKEKLGENYPAGALLPESGLAMAWCTADMGHEPIRSVAPFDDWNLLAFLRTEEGAMIAAFDHWLGNEDRNNGNLLRLPQGRYAVIDHGILFCYLDWRKGIIQPACNSLLLTKARQFVKEKRLTLKEYKRLTSGMAEFGYSHHRIAGMVYSEIFDIISSVEDSIAALNVLSCISERCPHRWVADQVGMLT